MCVVVAAVLVVVAAAPGVVSADVTCCSECEMYLEV